eukprot:1740660-Prymnesium_polylepis.1
MDSRRLRGGRGALAAAHLEAAGGLQRHLDPRGGRHPIAEQQRRHERDASQRRGGGRQASAVACRRRDQARCRARHFHVARTGEDDRAAHHVVGDDHAQRSGERGAEERGGRRRGRQASEREWVARRGPCKAAPAEAERRGGRLRALVQRLVLGGAAVEDGRADGARVAKRADDARAAVDVCLRAQLLWQGARRVAAHLVAHVRVGHAQLGAGSGAAVPLAQQQQQ